jgi:predicted nucleic acid-binding protein
VIYLDSSVALAHLLMEERRPPDALWQQALASSRLLQYEVWNRIHALRLDRSQGAQVRGTLARIYLVELSEPVLDRAMRPFPVPIRTLDSLHLATMLSLSVNGELVELASYDRRMLAAAGALGMSIAAL